MTVTINGSTGITTPALSSDAGITADGISFADGTPVNTLVTTTSGNVGIGVTPTTKLHVAGNILSTGSIDAGTQFLGLSTDTVAAPSFSWTGDTDTGIYRPASNAVGIVCGGSEEFRVDSTGQLWNSVNSQVGTDYTALYKGYLCRAWVNFNGTGTVAIRASGNVSSITDLGLGDYQVNFTTAMPDVDFCITGTAFSSRFLVDGNVRTTTSARVLARTDAGVFDDSLQTNVAIFR